MDIKLSKVLLHFLCLTIAILSFYLLWNVRRDKVVTVFSNADQIAEFGKTAQFILIGCVGFIIIIWFVNFLFFCINSRESEMNWNKNHLKIPMIISIALIIISAIFSVVAWSILPLPMLAAIQSVSGFSIWFFFGVSISIQIIVSFMQLCFLQSRGSIPVWNNWYQKKEKKVK